MSARRHSACTAREASDGERLCDRHAGFPYGAGDLVVRVAVLFLEREVAVGLLEGREVLSLEILHERDLQELAVRNVHFNAGNLGEPCFEGARKRRSRR